MGLQGGEDEGGCVWVRCEERKVRLGGGSRKLCFKKREREREREREYNLSQMKDINENVKAN